MDDPAPDPSMVRLLVAGGQEHLELELFGSVMRCKNFLILIINNS